MDGVQDSRDLLLRSAAKRLKGHQRRLFVAEVTQTLCGGSARLAEERFGWSRKTVEKGVQEWRSGVRCLENFAARAKPRFEDKNPELAKAIRDIAEPRTQADPELKSARCYTNVTAQEVCEELRTRGFAETDIPKERTMRRILNRMNYRLKRIRKGKPLKKNQDTDAIFANVKAAKEAYRDDPETLEISMDTKAKVNEGAYARGGKKPDRPRGEPRDGMGP